MGKNGLLGNLILAHIDLPHVDVIRDILGQCLNKSLTEQVVVEDELRHSFACIFSRSQSSVPFTLSQAFLPLQSITLFGLIFDHLHQLNSQFVGQVVEGKIEHL